MARRKGFQLGGLIGGGALTDLNDPKTKKMLADFADSIGTDASSNKSPTDLGLATPIEQSLPPEERRTSSGSEGGGGGFAKGGKVRKTMLAKRKR
jgi:hypothetical protein